MYHQFLYKIKDITIADRAVRDKGPLEKQEKYCGS